MCFSASASFGVAAALLPVGVYCVARARRDNPRWIRFAAFPLACGLQQAVEGTLWIGAAKQVRIFAVLILTSVILAHLIYDYAFTSVWCFFAAVLSLYVFRIVHSELRSARPTP